MPSVFITGASGCVGHYLIDALSPDYRLYLLVRNPSNLLFDPQSRPNVTVVTGDLEDISAHAGLLREMDYCIHVATAWGGPETERVNVQRSHELFAALSRKRIRRVVYFSTASILGRDMMPLVEAERYGTDYIRSKYLCHKSLPSSPVYDRIVTVFPTMVFGGDATHPISHVTGGLPKFKQFAWALGRINVEARFHYVHAEDIASMVRWILECPNPEKEYVLGNPALTLGHFLKRAAGAMGYRVGRQVTLSVPRLYRLARRMGARMSNWDVFCVRYRDFVYHATDCASLGLQSTHATVEEIAGEWAMIREVLRSPKRRSR